MVHRSDNNGTNSAQDYIPPNGGVEAKGTAQNGSVVTKADGVVTGVASGENTQRRSLRDMKIVQHHATLHGIGKTFRDAGQAVKTTLTANDFHHSTRSQRTAIDEHKTVQQIANLYDKKVDDLRKLRENIKECKNQISSYEYASKDLKRAGQANDKTLSKMYEIKVPWDSQPRSLIGSPADKRETISKLMEDPEYQGLEEAYNNDVDRLPLMEEQEESMAKMMKAFSKGVATSGVHLRTADAESDVVNEEEREVKEELLELNNIDHKALKAVDKFDGDVKSLKGSSVKYSDWGVVKTIRDAAAKRARHEAHLVEHTAKGEDFHYFSNDKMKLLSGDKDFEKMVGAYEAVLDDVKAMESQIEDIENKHARFELEHEDIFSLDKALKSGSDKDIKSIVKSLNKRSLPKTYAKVDTLDAGNRDSLREMVTTFKASDDYKAYENDQKAIKILEDQRQSLIRPLKGLSDAASTSGAEIRTRWAGRK